MEIIRGKIKSAQKVVIYGPEGIGKSTFASQFPNPIFIDTEDSTKHMDVARFPKPGSWSMLMEQIKYVKDTSNVCRTLVIDTADWAEQLCVAHVCNKSQKNGIEDFGYGKGYVYVAEEFGVLLTLLEDVIAKGINVVVTAHAKMRKFEQPDEMGAYDRWELKLSKNVAPLVKEWADIVLFANYKTYAVKNSEGKLKAQGGDRVMYTTHHPCWDAKNRFNLPPETKFSYAEIATCIEDNAEQATPPPKQEEPPSELLDTTGFVELPVEPDLTGVPKQLAELMREHQVTQEEIQRAVSEKGYYPELTPIANYDPQFINGVLVGAWEQVFTMIKDFREVPFK